MTRGRALELAAGALAARSEIDDLDISRRCVGVRILAAADVPRSCHRRTARPSLGCSSMAHDVLGKTNLADALTAEIKADSEFLPRQSVDDEADRDRKLAEGWLQAETNALSVRPTSVVAVHKSRYGRRLVPAHAQIPCRVSRNCRMPTIAAALAVRSGGYPGRCRTSWRWRRY